MVHGGSFYGESSGVEEGQCVAEKETEIVLYEQAPLSLNFITLN